MMDESKTPPTHLGSCRYLDLYQGVFGCVHHSIALLYHEVPNPNLTIRNFSIAVCAPRRCVFHAPHVRIPHPCQPLRAAAETRVRVSRGFVSGGGGTKRCTAVCAPPPKAAQSKPPDPPRSTTQLA
jgi:hypothetical protein